MSQLGTTANDPTKAQVPHGGAPVVDMTRDQQKAYDREVFQRLQADANIRVGEPAANAPQQAQKPASDTLTPPPPSATPPSQQGPSNPAVAQPRQDDASRREIEAIADSVLKRDGLSEKGRKAYIASLTPEELQADIGKRRQVQADTDRLGNKARQLEDQLKAGPTRTPDAKGEASQPDDLAGLTQRQRRLIETVRAEGDDDRAREMLEVMREGKQPPRTQVDQPYQPPQANQLPPEDAAMLAVEKALVRFRAPLDKLEGAYPELKNPEVRRELVRTADRLLSAGVIEPGADGKLPPPDQLFAKAASIRFGRDDPFAAQRSLLEDNLRERSGQPDPSNAGGQPPPALTGKDREREAYRLLQAGHSTDEVNAILGRKRSA